MGSWRAPGRLFATVPGAILVAAVLNLSIPYFALEPGPAQDVKPLIVLSGVRTFPSRGQLLMTTVSLSSVRVADALRGWVDPVVDVVPRTAVIPAGTSEREVERANQDQMEESKRSAAAAALALLGYPLRVTGAGARVEAVIEGTPAAALLRPGDLIVAVDRKRIEGPEDLKTRVRAHRVGETVLLRVLRDGKEQDLRVRTVRSREDPAVPMIGIEYRPVAGRIEFPFGVDIKLSGIGGPSAGLMFALGIVDLLQDGDLTKGLAVAGTGVIDTDGRVSPVGGVAQKVAAAERAGAAVFLVPRPELREARRAARRIRVIPVDSLGEAVQALHDLKLPLQAAGRD